MIYHFGLYLQAVLISRPLRCLFLSQNFNSTNDSTEIRLAHVLCLSKRLYAYAVFSLHIQAKGIDTAMIYCEADIFCCLWLRL